MGCSYVPQGEWMSDGWFQTAPYLKRKKSRISKRWEEGFWKGSVLLKFELPSSLSLHALYWFKTSSIHFFVHSRKSQPEILQPISSQVLPILSPYLRHAPFTLPCTCGSWFQSLSSLTWWLQWLPNQSAWLQFPLKGCFSFPTDTPTDTQTLTHENTVLPASCLLPSVCPTQDSTQTVDILCCATPHRASAWHMGKPCKDNNAHIPHRTLFSFQAHRVPPMPT